jgi:signal transduction histidine kinase
VAEAVDVAKSRAETKSVAVRLESPAEPLPGNVDHDRLLSLLTNLIFNAIDAAPVGGEVGVSVATRADGKIAVVVTDTGPGIDLKVANRLFTPFTTTKPTGTGLGLTVAQRVAREHGGALTAADRPGGGACFTLLLPAMEETHAEALGR